MTKGADEKLARRAAFREWTAQTVRYGDMDAQSHVNNTAFATFSESGRVHFLYDKFKHLVPEGCYFVIARLVINYRQEVLWPATVDVGTAVLAIGGSSFTLGQGMFVGGDCVATAENVLVLASHATRRATPLPEPFRQHLGGFLLR